MIWRRHVEQAPDPVAQGLFQNAGRPHVRLGTPHVPGGGPRHRGVAAGCDSHARSIRHRGGQRAPPAWTWNTFAVRPMRRRKADLVFVGSMDWLPNSDGVNYFVREILPLIWQRKPDCTLAVVGRAPSPAMLALAQQDSRIHVTGTVPDVRPWLWGASASIVPLRIGGGTRLKIYEAMAAGTATVSTSIGAEGLDVCPSGKHPAGRHAGSVRGAVRCLVAGCPAAGVGCGRGTGTGDVAIFVGHRRRRVRKVVAGWQSRKRDCGSCWLARTAVSYAAASPRFFRA